MKLFLDQKNRRFVKSAASNVALDRLVLKRRDQVPVEIIYVENGVAITPPIGTEATVALKAKFSDTNFLALAAPGQTILDLFTAPVEAAFSSSPASISALLEVKWTAPSQALRTATLQVELQNSVITGDEGTPASVPDGKATQAEAEAGTDHTKWMTPLRTAQAIAELAPPPTWDSVLEKPTTFPPSAHTHTASQITDFASAVVAVSPPVDWSSLTGKPSTFAPSAHTHPISEVANLQTELDSVNDRIDSALANLDPAALDSIAEAVTVINGERTERIAADAQLQTSISQETTARTSADAAIQTTVAGKAALVHTHTASQITDFAAAVVAAAPGLSINTTIRVADGVSDTYPIDGLASNDPESVLVALNGVTQAPTLDYSVSLASGTITFDSAPATGTQIAATAIGLRSVQPPIDPTLYLLASDVDGTTAYFGRLLNSDLPAAPALPESANTWRIRRIVTNSSGQILTTTTATGSWASRTSLSYAP